MAKSKKAFGGYVSHGRENSSIQAAAVAIVLGAVVFLFLVAAHYNYFGN